MYTFNGTAAINTAPRADITLASVGCQQNAVMGPRKRLLKHCRREYWRRVIPPGRIYEMPHTIIQQVLHWMIKLNIETNEHAESHTKRRFK